MVGWIGRQMGGRIDRQADRWINGKTDRQIYGWTNGRVVIITYMYVYLYKFIKFIG